MTDLVHIVTVIDGSDFDRIVWRKAFTNVNVAHNMGGQQLGIAKMKDREFAHGYRYDVESILLD